MEYSKEGCRLLEDCFTGKVDLIVTQKVSNVSSDWKEMSFMARMLAAQEHPVGIYFISEDIFTLASYYQADLRDTGLLPEGWQTLPADELDANAGKIDLIIVKNISRFARNVVDCLSIIRKLSEKKIGVLFESEAIYSLNDDSHMALSFQATIAEQESRTRSRSMETSLRMRLDHGLPLTPELLGFVKNEDGKLVVNPETYKIPKLMFYMYLYGYSTQQIADILTKLSKRTYLGNLKWTASGVAASMRNERYCGDVLTRKRFTKFAADVHDQKSFKNRGEKPQSHYRDDHEAIIDRNDFLAVQRIMNNARFGGTSLLPELQVIPDGLLKGFVIVHPKWGSFTKEDYIAACRSVDSNPEDERRLEVREGSFDLTGYEVADFKLFSDQSVPAIMLHKDSIAFSVAAIREMDLKDNYMRSSARSSSLTSKNQH